MSKKVIYIGIALTIAFFLKKEYDKNKIVKQKPNTKKVEVEKKITPTKIEKIKVEIFHLIEAFHYKYKAETMTEEDLKEYEKIINKIVE